MVYRTPAPRSSEAAERLGRPQPPRHLVRALRRLSRPGPLISAGFGALAAVSGWWGLRCRSLDEAKGYFALALAYVVSAACTGHLWARVPAKGLLAGDELGKKLTWSVLLTLPLIGPLFYGALYEPLPPNDLPNRSLRWLGWLHVS
jgi:hypothetical protein